MSADNVTSIAEERGTDPVWQAVADLSDEIGEHGDDIPGAFSYAPESQAELARARELLTEAQTLLERTAQRESRRYSANMEAQD